MLLYFLGRKLLSPGPRVPAAAADAISSTTPAKQANPDPRIFARGAGDAQQEILQSGEKQCLRQSWVRRAWRVRSFYRRRSVRRSATRFSCAFSDNARDTRWWKLFNCDVDHNGEKSAPPTKGKVSMLCMRIPCTLILWRVVWRARLYFFGCFNWYTSCALIVNYNFLWRRRHVRHIPAL